MCEQGYHGSSWSAEKKSSGSGLLPTRPPLRTVRESFPSYGSSLSNRCSRVWARGGISQPMRDNASGALSLGRSVCPALAPAPPTAAARLEVSRAVRVVGIGGPTNFDMALDSGAGGPGEGEHLALALFLGEPDAEESLGRREVLALLP